MRSRPLFGASLVLAVLAGRPAVAEEQAPFVPGPELRPLKVGLAPVIAPRKWGRSGLERGLKESLQRGLDELVPPARIRRATKQLGLRGERARSIEGLVRAGRRAGVDWVLRVEVTRDGWLYTARALLLRTDTGEEEMDFRSGYYKPKTETRDRGQRIGLRTLEKLATLLEEREVPGGATSDPGASDPRASDPGASDPGASDPRASAPGASDPSASDTRASDTRASDTRASDPRASDPRASDPSASDPRASDSGAADPASAAGPTPSPGDGLSPGASSEGGSAGASASPSREARGAGYRPVDLRADPPRPPSASAARATSATPRPRARRLYLSLGAGAGLLRTYDLSAPGLERSRLSYTLDPLSLITLRARFTIPETPLELATRGALRFVAYDVPTSGGEAASPSGLFVDARLTAGWRFGLGAKDEVAILPRVGVRFSRGSVDDNPGPVLLESTTLVVLAGLGARLPLTEALELAVGVDGGPIVLYDEAPQVTGEAGLGWSLGGDLDVRVWLTDELAIVVDNRFSYDAVPFGGAPSRTLPTGERGILSEAQLGVRDLRSSLGVALRL